MNRFVTATHVDHEKVVQATRPACESAWVLYVENVPKLAGDLGIGDQGLDGRKQRVEEEPEFAQLLLRETTAPLPPATALSF